MPRFRFTIAYDGTGFHGWQRQEPPQGGPLRTVQGEVERAAREVLRAPVVVVGASRTDAGVHAVGQVGACTAETSIPVERLAMALTSRLPEDVQVRTAEIVPDDFEPIAHCLSKGYCYRLAHGGPPSHWPNLFDRHYRSFCHHHLDPARMHAAAAHVVGTHDFAGFAHAAHGRESTVRTVDRCAVIAESLHELRIEVSGNGFLYNMVRIIAGTLVEAGRGRLDPETLPAIIEARERRLAGPTLPAHGLCLMWVRYAGATLGRPFEERPVTREGFA